MKLFRSFRRPMPALLALLLALICAPTPGNGYTETGTIEAAAEDLVTRQLGRQLGVRAGPLDSRVRMAACSTALQTKLHSTSSASTRTVEVSCAAPLWRLYVPVRISDLGPRLVLTRSLGAGEMLREGDVRVEQRDRAQLGNGPSDPAQVIGQLLRRPLSAGQLLEFDSLGLAPSIKRGQIVTLISGSNGFAVRASGKALAAGAPGELVSVENLTSGRVVQGRILDDGQVAVGL